MRDASELLRVRITVDERLACAPRGTVARTTVKLAFSSETEFDALLTEWQRIPAPSPGDDLAAWDSAMTALAGEERGLRAAGRWCHGRDDLFGVLGLARDEVRHSRMIAWLFDPCARHGLGVRLLERVLRLAFGDELDEEVFVGLASARPRCEVFRDQGRVDLLVASPGLFLVVENKVDAAEAARQCDGYYESFAAEPGVRFLFLTPSGRSPVSATAEAALAFKVLSYPQMREALRASLKDSDPKAGGRPAAEQYLRTLDKEF